MNDYKLAKLCDAGTFKTQEQFREVTEVIPLELEEEETFLHSLLDM